MIIFGIRGDDRDWMPDHEHNFLSWSFGFAVVGTFFAWMASILFWAESRILYKKQLRKDLHYRMESNVGHREGGPQNHEGNDRHNNHHRFNEIKHVHHQNS